MNRSRVIQLGVLLLLSGSVLYSSIQLPVRKQQKIERLNALREQIVIRDKAQEEWSRLLLAVTDLQMHMPTLSQRRELLP